MLHGPIEATDPFFQFDPAYHNAHFREFDLEANENTEGGWPIFNRRIRCGLGQLDLADYPRGEGESVYSRPIPASVDRLAKRNRIHHYQRIRSAEEAWTLLQGAMPSLSMAYAEIEKSRLSHMVFANAGTLPIQQLSFAYNVLKQLSRRSVESLEWEERRILLLANFVMDDLSSPVIWLNRFGERTVTPRISPIRGFRASFEITEQWRDPVGGIIIDDDAAEIIGIHDVAIVGVSLSDRHFIFKNTWGDWGFRGEGFMPFDYFNKHLIEAWDFGFPDVKPSFVTGSGIQTLRWTAGDIHGGLLYGSEIYNVDEDEKLGWAFAVVRDGYLDIEELFVRPGYRCSGLGERLAFLMRDVSLELGLPLRAFIPFGDAWTGNIDAAVATLKKVSLTLHPSGVKWAAYKALRGAVTGSAFFPARIPSRSMYVFKDRDNKTPSHRKGPSETEYSCDASMDDIVEASKTISVFVNVRVLNLSEDVRQAVERGTFNADPSKNLIAQIIPRSNLEVVNDSRYEFPAPTPGNPCSFFFDVRASDLGLGEVWIVLRQGPVPILTLKLKTRIVEAKVEPSKIAVDSAIVSQPKESSELPLHQLTIYEREHGGHYSFQYELRSPTLGILCQHVSEVISPSKKDYINSIYREIEMFCVESADDEDEFQALVRSYGGELFDQLFPAGLQRALWDHRNEIESILVVSTEPFIPWELVHLKEPGMPLAEEVSFFCQLGLVRWLHKGWPKDVIKIRPGRARFIIPQYDDPELFLQETSGEGDYLVKAFKATPVPAKITDVRKLISKPDQFDLLHFAGHGTAEIDRIHQAALVLEGAKRLATSDNGADEIYKPSLLTTTMVEQNSNLRRPDNDGPMIFVNACQAGRMGQRLTSIGGFAAAFIERGAGSFVGSLWEVKDGSARVFFEAFFDALIAGHTLSQAARSARLQTRKSGDATWISYVVYGHPHAQLKNS